MDGERMKIRFSKAEQLVFKPKEDLTVSQWAEKRRIVTNGPMPGPWSNARTPYLVEPMDTWGLPWVRRVVLCFAPQTGKTQVAFNCLGFAIDQDPGSAMYVMPDEKTARRISRRRILPMLKDSPATARMLGDAYDTSTLYMNFINGMDLMMVWATSAQELASESARYMFFDETDKYPEFSGREADPISLGEVRTNTYPHTRKLLYLSTPTTEDGLIWKALNTECDEIRDYHVPCPFCGAWQVMTFENIVFPKDQRDPRVIQRKKLAWYQCVKCGMDWDDTTRNRAVAKGKWIAREPIERPETVGFHLPSWYSPFVSLSSVAASFLQGLHDPNRHMAFATQHKAEAWVEVIERKEETEILKNRTNYPPHVVPETAVALTCGIDVQKVGFWYVVRAWEPDLSSHLIDYGFLPDFPQVESLVFGTQYRIMGSEATMTIWRAAMDTGGGPTDDGEWSRTEEIYQWIRNNGRGVVWGTKGSSRPQFQKVMPRTLEKMARGNRPIPGGLVLYLLDVDKFKEAIHFRLGRKDGDSQRFFLHAQTGIDYARQILAEEKRRDRRGKTEWKQIRRDNHLLDCEVMAAACADSEWAPGLTTVARMVKQRAEQDRAAARQAPKSRKSGFLPQPDNWLA